MSEFLKCDALGCDHREDVAEITELMVGKPCPSCGSNLLSQADYDHYATVFRPMMKVMEELGLAKPADASTPAELKTAFNYHDGELRIRLPTPTKQDGTP